jgi:hypothetical protein
MEEGDEKSHPVRAFRKKQHAEAFVKNHPGYYREIVEIELDH